MEHWMIEDSEPKRYDTEQFELFLYQRMRAIGGRVERLSRHLEIIKETADIILSNAKIPTAQQVEKLCSRVLAKGGYSPTATHIVELRVWQSGRHLLRVVETSLYKEFALRVMRPKATIIDSCNYPLLLPTSAALSAVDFMHAVAYQQGYQATITTDNQGFITTIDGACPILVRGTEITVGCATSSLYTEQIVSALPKMVGYTYSVRPISATELSSADELFYADARGITAIGSVGEKYLADSVAYAISKKITF